MSFAQALRYWLWLGCVSFGGPAGQIAIMHAELVEKRRWISEKRFLHALNYCMLLPGPEAQQLATYIGWLMHGVKGGVAAGALFVLPSLLVLIGLSWIYMAWGNVPAVSAALWGVKPAVVAVVLFAAYRIGSRALKNIPLRLLAAAAFIAAFALQVPFPLIVLLSGLVGYVGGRFVPKYFEIGGSHKSAQSSGGGALIGDDSPTPAHARYRTSRLILTIAAGMGLWLLGIGCLAALNGAGGALTQMGTFFTSAALLTFGGAYAVLPYVFQGAVITHGWLTAGQMLDGLALGETTPGPLIMVVAFVGFVGGWSGQVFGPEHLLGAGAAAATVATYFTFLPSFVFILAGGPLVEATHGDLRFTAPLTGITAAVVGVILNLALFFAWHVLWPRGFSGNFDFAAAAIGAAAFTALYRFKLGIIRVIAACAAAGFIWRVLI